MQPIPDHRRQLNESLLVLNDSRLKTLKERSVMKSLSLIGRIGSVAIAVGSLFVAMPHASAVPVAAQWRTGTGATGVAGQRWNNGANWVSGTAPTSGANLLFTSNTTASSITTSQNFSSFTTPSLELSGTTAYTFQGNPLTISASGTINNTSSSGVTHRFSNGINATAPGFTINNSGYMEFDSVPISGPGSTVTFIGVGTTYLSTNSTADVVLASGDLMITNGKSIASFMSGTTSPSELLFGTPGGSIVVNGNYTASSALTTTFKLDSTTSYNQLAVDGNVNFNSQQLSLDLSTLGNLSSISDRGTSFDLFASGTSSIYSGNISGVISSGTGDYVSLGPWFLENGSYRSNTFGANGNYFYFDQTNGNLVVVPEPSAMVVAGIGVALAGWRMARRRKGAKTPA